MLKVLEHILMSRPVEQPEHGPYNEAVKDLQADSVYELQRLATKMPDQLLVRLKPTQSNHANEFRMFTTNSTLRLTRSFLLELLTLRDRLPIKLSSLQSCMDDELNVLEALLTNNSLRATKIDTDVRLQKLHGFINPVKQLWQNPEMDSAISSFGGFSNLLGLSNVRDYLVSRRVHEIDEWGLYQLDAEGQGIQKTLEERLKVSRTAFYRDSI